MKCVYFLNGERGRFILKQILKLKLLEINSVICCNKKIKKQMENINEFKKFTFFFRNINSKRAERFLKKISPDLFIIAGYPQIFKKRIIKIPKKMAINLHAGPLPKYRGGSPLNWQIINQEKKIGISIIKIDQGIDTGPILMQKKFNFNKNDDIESVHKKANIHFYLLLTSLIKKIKNKNFKAIIQKPNKKYKYWNQRSDQDGYINFSNKNYKQVISFIKALTKPYPGAWTKLKIKKKLKKVRLYSAQIIKKKINFYNENFILKNEKLLIKCKNRILLINDYKFF